MNLDYTLLRQQAIAVERAIDKASQKDKVLLNDVADLLAFLQVKGAYDNEIPNEGC